MSTPVVDIKGLWSVFHAGGRHAVIHQDLNLRIEAGEMLSIVGGSGSGKTVLLRQMLGLEVPTRGSVTVLGESAASMGREGAASRVGMLFQHARCSRHSACWTTSPLRCANSKPCPPT